MNSELKGPFTSRAMYTGNVNDSTVMVDTSKSWGVSRTSTTKLEGESAATAAARAAKNRAAVRSNYGARHGHKGRRMNQKNNR